MTAIALHTGGELVEIHLADFVESVAGVFVEGVVDWHDAIL